MRSNQVIASTSLNLADYVNVDSEILTLACESSSAPEEKLAFKSDEPEDTTNRSENSGSVNEQATPVSQGMTANESTAI